VDPLEIGWETPRIYQQGRSSGVGSTLADSVTSTDLEQKMINPANLAALVAQYRDKQSSEEPTNLPRRPSPKRIDR
jgi:hypothetical protein